MDEVEDKRARFDYANLAFFIYLTTNFDEEVYN